VTSCRRTGLSGGAGAPPASHPVPVFERILDRWVPPEYSDRPFVVKPFDERASWGPWRRAFFRPNPARMGFRVGAEVLSAIGLQLRSAAGFETGAFERTCDGHARPAPHVPSRCYSPRWSSSRRSIGGRLLRQRPIARTRLRFAKDDNRNSHRADTELGLRRIGRPSRRKSFVAALRILTCRFQLSPPRLGCLARCQRRRRRRTGYIAAPRPFRRSFWRPWTSHCGLCACAESMSWTAGLVARTGPIEGV
jgi:hypothetical protein